MARRGELKWGCGACGADRWVSADELDMRGADTWYTVPRAEVPVCNCGKEMTLYAGQRVDGMDVRGS